MLVALVAVVAGIVFFTAGPACASFHEQMALDTEAMALGNNVTASPPGIMAIHYNPAGLSLMSEGDFISQGLTIPIIRVTSKFTADPDFKGFAGSFNQDPLAGTQGTSTSGKMYIPFLGEVNTLIAPSLGFSHRAPGSKWTFAIGQYAPFGVGVNHGDPNDPARFGGQSVYHQHLIYAAPAVSYQVSDTFSVGASVGLGQTAMGARLDMRSPNDLVAMTRVLGNSTSDLEIPILSELTFPAPWFGGGVSPYDKLATATIRMRDDFTPSYNLGALWKPTDWFQGGLSYQSAISAHMVGRYTIEYSDQWQRMVNWFGSSPTLMVISGMLGLPTKAVPVQSGVVTEDFTFPQIVNLGVKVKPVPRLALLGDLHWANWSSIKNDTIVFDQKIQLLQFVKVLGYPGGDNVLYVNRNLKDTWNYGFGVEFQALDWLLLRAGYERRRSSTQRNLYDLLYALPDLDSYGAGIGIKLPSGVSVDLAAGYLINRSFTIKDNGSTNLNSTDFTKPVYNPYAGLIFEQKTVSYLWSAKITMPLGVAGEMLHKQKQMLAKAARLLNPFTWFADAEPGEKSTEKN
ncbi:hypothetical protein GMSM_34100 [Geomonas sp. Red276]